MSSSQDNINYYAVLGIPDHSTDQIINSAYKKLVLVYHPDKAGGDELSVRRFHQIQEAVETLRDPKRRHLHDEALTSNLDNLNTVRMELRRYYASDDRRNWFPEVSPWPSDNRTYNFDDPNVRYMFTYGTGVHMDPDSEASRAEKARHENGIAEWELRGMGIYPDVERKKRQFRKAAMEFLVRRDEAEMEYAETLRPESARRAAEEKLSDSYMEHEELFMEDEGDCDDYIGEGYHAGYDDDGHIEPDTTFDISTASTNTSTEPFLPMEASFVIDKSDFEHTNEADNGAYMAENVHPIIDSNTGIDRADPLACHDSYGATTNGKIAELLRPFIQFFAMKLERYSTKYKADDMYAEMRGLMLEIYVDWLERTRLSLTPDTDSSTPTIDRYGRCCHRGPWSRTFGVPECQICRLWMPAFVLTCPHCGHEACIRCKSFGN